MMRNQFDQDPQHRFLNSTSTPTVTLDFNTPTDNGDFDVAIFCALPLEADAVLRIFDRIWDDDVCFKQAEQDHNSYTAGSISQHNVVLVHMGGMGGVNAANAAAGVKLTFSQIKLALTVGICGGVPKASTGDIFLGDLVFSTAISEYDFGTHLPNRFRRKTKVDDILGRPMPKIRALFAKLRTNAYRAILQAEIGAIQQSLASAPETRYPSVENDHLYQASYLHKHRSQPNQESCAICETDSNAVCDDALTKTCIELGCQKDYIVHRSRTNLPGGGASLATTMSPPPLPAIHFGNYGCGSAVIRSGTFRDRVAKDDDIIAFEMEGIGTWEHFPSIVVKAVCDYADSHKNKKWQDYAASVAAAGTKAFLNRWPPSNRTSDSGSRSIFHNYGSVGTQIDTQNITGNVNNTFSF